MGDPREQKIRSTFEVIIFFILIIFASNPLTRLIITTQSKLLGNKDMLLLTPDYLLDISGIILIVLIFFVYSGVTNSEWLKKIKGKLFFFLLLLAMISLLVNAFLSATVYYDDKIVQHSLFSKRIYQYSDIKEVRITDLKKRFSISLSYYLLMNDKSIIDIANGPSELRYIPKIEAHIDESVPHVIHKYSYKIIKNSGLQLPANFDQFKIVDYMDLEGSK